MAWDLRRVRHILLDLVKAVVFHPVVVWLWAAVLGGLVAILAAARGLDPEWTYVAVGFFAAFSLVALVGGAAQYAHRRPPRPPAQRGVSDLTPVEIWQQLESLPLAQRLAVATSYLGLVVEWEMVVAGASHMPLANDRVQLQLRWGSVVDKPVWARVDEAPGTGLLSKGERGVVTGTIAVVTTHEIGLDPAEFTLARRTPP
jgi:hypothetical protein